MDIAIELLRTALAESEGPEGVRSMPADFKAVGGWLAPEDLAGLYIAAGKAVEDAGDDRAKIAVELLKLSPGDGDTPTERIERFTEIAEALRAKGVAVSIYDDPNYQMTVL